MELKKITKQQLLQEVEENPFFGKKEPVKPGAYVPKQRLPKEPWQMSPEEKEYYHVGDKQAKIRDSQARPAWFEKQEGEKFPPDAYVYDDPFTPGNDAVMVYVPKGLTPITEQELEQAVPDFYNFFKERGANFYFLQLKKPRFDDPLEVTKFEPTSTALKYREKAFGSSDVFKKEEPTRETTDQAIILTDLIYPPLRSVEELLNEKLRNTGFPPLGVPNRERMQKAAINRYSTINNDSVQIQILMLHRYSTVEQYIEAARLLARGTKFEELPAELKPAEEHQVREYNPGRRYSRIRKSEKMDAGYRANPKTEILRLAKRGFSETDYDMTIGTELTIDGRVQEDGHFDWNFKLETGYGKKLREETRVRGGFTTDAVFESEATSYEPVQKGINIAEQPAVVQAYNEALTQLTDKIMSINSRAELRNRYRQLGPEDISRQVQESIIQKVISELKK